MDLLENNELLVKAVKTLRNRVNSKVKKEKKNNLKQLFSDGEINSHMRVNLVLSLIKIPKIPRHGRVQPVTIRSPIPHSFVDELTGVLLITKDLKGYHTRKSDYQPSVHGFRDLLREHDSLGLVTEVMPLRQLLREYKDFESKRNLSSQFQIVLCDDTVIRRIPNFLGKPFYKSKKRPIQVNLKAKDVRKEIKSALSKSYLHLNLEGTCGMTQIGQLNQSDGELAENILATVEGWKEKLPGGWANVRSLHLKTDSSKSIPLYMSLKLPNDILSVIHPNVKSDETLAIDHISTLSDSLVVEVKRSGAVQVLPADEEEREKRAVELDRDRLALRDKYDPTENRIIRGIQSKAHPNHIKNEPKRKMVPTKSTGTKRMRSQSTRPTNAKKKRTQQPTSGSGKKKGPQNTKSTVTKRKMAIKPKPKPTKAKMRRRK